MLVPLTTLAVAGQLVVAAADKIPDVDMRRTCRVGGKSDIGARPNREACLDTEAKARRQLAADWDKFAAADRRRCIETTRAGGPPSYVEMLTCMEMARDARDLPGGNTGIAPASR